MRQNQHSPPKGVRNTGSDSEVAHLTTPISECPPTRRSARAKGTLIYDQKYHPMDDFIRPSQAAKRRSLHGEVVELFGCSGTSTDPSGSEVGTSQNAWPEIKGLPFSIFTERMEDQLHAEAEAASPFHYNDDDKENDVTNPELTPVPNPLDGISIIPASHYRQRLGPHALPRHGAMVSNAFYAHPRFEASPYGLGWSDGAHDLNNGDTHDCPADEYMRILASSEHLPRSSLQIEDSLGAGGTAMSSSPARNVETLELLR
ncbi:hypothetical protein N0V95_007256 [Ascochyta clinopodiicola]|nr:hypothetical protein N0V95_007256 [Ascochyta clinopodiicola]